jgi:hypothetical protein
MSPRFGSLPLRERVKVRGAPRILRSTTSLTPALSPPGDGVLAAPHPVPILEGEGGSFSRLLQQVAEFLFLSLFRLVVELLLGFDDVP